MADATIRVAGAQAESFRCAPGDTVLAAALRSGLGFPYECNSGGCGSCQFELLEGAVEDIWPGAPGISERQRGRGRHLACQSRPAGDCAIKVAIDPALAPPVAPAPRQAAFIGRRMLTHDMAEFSFCADSPAVFLPGQYAMLQLPGVAGARAYSMSGPANDDGIWRFVIRRVSGGQGTAYLFDAMPPGAEIGIDGPYGNSYLRPGTGRGIVCIAGGSGLSPVLSILQAAVAAPELAGRDIMLFHGGRGPADMCAAAELDADPRLRDAVRLYTAISDDSAPGAAAWQGDRGMIHELARTVLGDRMADYDFYFCGPPAMTDAVHRMLLLEAKVPAAHLHFDRFY